MLLIDPDDPHLDRIEAAAFLDKEPGTLSVWDCTKRYDLKPERYHGKVYYRRSVLIEHRKRELRPA